jgi:hypothetical protein
MVALGVELGTRVDDWLGAVLEKLLGTLLRTEFGATVGTSLVSCYGSLFGNFLGTLAAAPREGCDCDGNSSCN